MKMMEWLKDNDCPISEKICKVAVEHGNRMLNWLKTKGFPGSDK